MKDAFHQNKPLSKIDSDDLPDRFIPNRTKRYIHKRKKILVDRYEFLIYRLLRHRIEAGDIFCRDSIRFCSFEDDLITNQQWQQKETFIADMGLTNFNQSIHSHLAELEEKLESRIAEVNENISSGKNEHLQIKKGVNTPVGHYLILGMQSLLTILFMTH
nr:hypothetical protein [Shimazuella alba]